MNENSGSRYGSDPLDSLPRPAPCRRFRVTGRVQGVFFRDSTREQAVRLGLTGSARNLPDGSVEVLACGPSDALERLGAWLRNGPPMASVESVEATDVESRSPGKFRIG